MGCCHLCCQTQILDNDSSSTTCDPQEKEAMLEPSDPHLTQTLHSVQVKSESEDDYTVEGKRNSNDTSKHYKIIFLGPGMSGKSTLFKQIRKLHGTAYTTKDFMNCKPQITANIIESFRKLSIYSDILPDQDYVHLDTTVTQKNRTLRDQCARLTDRAIFDKNLCNIFKRLLADKGIQNTLQYRNQFQLSDNFDYLIQHMDEYCNAEYIPTYQDFVHVKFRSVGILKLSFRLKAKNDEGTKEYYDLHDAGGQRTERPKWLNVIHNTTAYIFVCAISGYNQTLWEEPSRNRMREAIHLFRVVYHMEALRKAHCILFLNKYDLFLKKLSVFSIKEQFPDYEGKETPELVAAFIVNKFREQQNPKYALRNGESRSETADRSFYFHLTSATDTGCVNRVFELCRDIIVVNTLTNIGFIA